MEGVRERSEINVRRGKKIWRKD